MNEHNFPVFVKYKNTFIDLWTCSGKKINWRGDLNLFGRSLDDAQMPDLSKIIVYGDVIVSGNRLKSFKKLPRFIKGSLYANFNDFQNYDGFPECIQRECHALGSPRLGEKQFNPEQLGSEFVLTQKRHWALQAELEQELRECMTKYPVDMLLFNRLQERLRKENPISLHLEYMRLSTKEYEEIDKFQKNREKHLQFHEGKQLPHSVWSEPGFKIFPSFNLTPLRNQKENPGRE